MKLNLLIRNSYKNDYKEAKKKNILTPQIDNELDFLIECLLNRAMLEQKYKDHQLKGSLKDFRECHLR